MLPALLITLILPASQDENLKSRVDRLVRQLESDDIEIRDQAEQSLIQLGIKAEPIVRSQLKEARSDEVRVRLKAVLQWFVPIHEEKYALKCLENPEPVPKGRRTRHTVQGGNVFDAVSLLADAFGIRIRFFPDDRELIREAKDTPVRGASTSGSPAALLLSLVSGRFHATWVVEEDRVTIVRLTPAVLLRKLELEGVSVTRLRIRSELDMFGRRRAFIGSTINHYLLSLGRSRGPDLEKWLAVLSAAVRNTELTLQQRGHAIRALSWIQAGSKKPNEELTRILLGIRRSKAFAETLRTRASLSLVYGSDANAIQSVVADLEEGEPGLRKLLLHRIATVPKKEFRTIPGLIRVLKELEPSGDADLSVRATSVRVLLQQKGAAEKLLAEKRTVGKQTLLIMMDAWKTLKTTFPKPVLDRVLRLTKHEDSEVRAGAATLLGQVKGPLKKTLDLLADPEPIVRWAAVRALLWLFPNRDPAEDWTTVPDRLMKHQETKKNEFVKAMIRSLLDRLSARDD